MTRNYESFLIKMRSKDIDMYYEICLSLKFLQVIKLLVMTCDLKFTYKLQLTHKQNLIKINKLLLKIYKK